MSKLPRVSGKGLIAGLVRAGFIVVRVRGSHHFLSHSDGRKTVIPVHSNETIGPGLLTKILRDLDLSSDQLSGLLS